MSAVHFTYLFCVPCSYLFFSSEFPSHNLIMLNPGPFPFIKYFSLIIIWSRYTEKWMGKPSMSPIQAGRRGPRREVEAGATNPMETSTKDTASSSATSHMMWNGKLSKTWWKRKVRCLNKGLTQSALDKKDAASRVILFDHCSFEGLLGNLCWNLSCTMLLEISFVLFETKVLDEVPLICPSTTELPQTCTSAGWHTEHYSPSR